MSGSRIAAAAGISPWESPFSLYFRMNGDLGELEQTDQMRAGNELEPIVINRFEEDYPHIKVVRNPGTWLNRERPWQLANPDALLRFPSTARRPVWAVFEAKTARYSDGWGKEWTDEIPVHYLAQVLWYLNCLGLQYCIIGVRFAGVDQCYYLVEADDVAAGELLSIGRQFLDDLESGKLPDLDGHVATLRAVKELHPEIDGTTVDIPDHLGIALVREKSRLIVPTERFNLAKAELASFMGTAKVALWNGVKIADRRSKNGGIPYIQLAGNLPAPTAVPSAPREKVSA